MKKIFICAGGTGGHIFPSLCIAQNMRRYNKSLQVIFLGTKRGLEKKLLPDEGFAVEFVRARGWDRQLNSRLLLTIMDNVFGFFQTLYCFLKHRPVALLAMGSYVSLLGAVWARVFRVPIYLHEQNVYPGLANRIIAKWAKLIFLSTEESKEFFKNVPTDKMVVIGNPIREEVASWKGLVDEARAKLGLDPHKKTLLVMGGSLGSQTINRVFWEILPHFSPQEFQIIHITGAEDFQRGREKTKESGFNYLVFDFFSNPGILMAASDLVVARAGASTVFELFYFGLPSVLIPFAQAADGHQLMNARWLAAKQKAIVLEEEELSGMKLKEAIDQLLRDNLSLQREERRLMPDAGEKITRIVIEDLQRRKGFDTLFAS